MWNGRVQTACSVVLLVCCRNDYDGCSGVVLFRKKEKKLFSGLAAGKAKSEKLEKSSLYCKVEITWTVGFCETEQSIQGNSVL